MNKDGKIDEKDVRDIGYPKYPLYTAGMNLGVSWKGFDFSMTWSAAFKTSRLLSSMYRVPFGESNNSAVMKYMIEDAWTPEKGNSAKAPALSFKSKSHNYQDSDLWLRDAWLFISFFINEEGAHWFTSALCFRLQSADFRQIESK